MYDFKNKMQTYSEYLEEYRKKLIETNNRNVIKDAENKDHNLIQKIKNFRNNKLLCEERDNLSVDLILQKIKDDVFYRSIFRKEPSRQSIHEKTQYDYIKKYLYGDVVKLKDNTYITKTTIQNNIIRSSDSSKTFDVYIPSKKCYGILKYIELNGGAQDNQYKDVVIFLENIISYLNNNSEQIFSFSFFLDGKFFTEEKFEKLNMLIPLHLNNKIYITSCQKINIKDIKQNYSQFYTKKCSYIFDTLDIDIKNILKKNEKINIIEPFSGEEDIVDWIKQKFNNCNILEYDIFPKNKYIIQQDTLLVPPDYSNSFVVTNPPFKARNKTKDKTVFDKYKTNDLFKCFVLELCNDKNKCLGGILILPLNFLLSPRKNDTFCRDKFLSNYRILTIKCFEEKVFEDTSIPVIAFSFIKSDIRLREQSIKWVFLPSHTEKIFVLNSKFKWIVGGEIYSHFKLKNDMIKRFVNEYKLKENEYQTNLTLHALDIGSNKICLEYKKDFIYHAKNSSRTYATLIVIGFELNEEQQKVLATLFNEFITQKRELYNSLFLPCYRETKEYIRKRIPFSLAFGIVEYLIKDPFSNLQSFR